MAALGAGDTAYPNGDYLALTCLPPPDASDALIFARKFPRTNI